MSPYARFFYCVTFESACSIDSNYITATEASQTLNTVEVSDRGFSCWWEISFNRTTYNENYTTIIVDILSLDNVTAYIGQGSSRDTVTSFTHITSTTSFYVPGLQNFYIAVIPVNGMLTSNFTMSYYINAQTFAQTNNYGR